MNEMRKLMEAVKQLDEAYQGGKTEHSGAKKGKGAFYGRKKEAKRDSNKNRRRADKDAVSEDNGFKDGYKIVIDKTPITDRKGNILTIRATEYKGSPHSIDGVRVVIDQTRGEDGYFLATDLNTLERIVEMVKRAQQSNEGLAEGEYGDYESGEDAIYDYGVVRANLMFSDGEATLTHGHGENIFLTIDEWNEFVGELKDT